jgi:hypothetical protein
MLLSSVFERFVAERPYCVMVRAALERMLDPQRLNALFRELSERQYERELLFSQVVEAMGRVVCRVEPSVLAAYRAMKDVLGVSDEAFYQKLRGIELSVSQGLVRDAFAQAAAVLEQLQVLDPPWVSGYHARILDGNYFSRTQRRIKELRTIWDAPLPGRALVVWDQETRLVRDVFPTEHGQASERSLMPLVLETVQLRDLWIADRNFCTLGFPFGIAQRGGCFVIRQHGQLKYQAVGRPCAKRRNAQGQACFEQRVCVTFQGESLMLRRVTIRLTTPTREGDLEIHVLTNLPARAASAQHVGELYRSRWTIEIVFLELQTALTCEVNTLGYPRAAVFTFCLALLLENALGLLKGSLRAAHGDDVVEQQLSFALLSQEVQKTYDGMLVQIPAEHWSIFREMSLRKFAHTMRQLAAQVIPGRYRKSVRGPKKKPPPKRRYRNGHHVSTAKLLELRRPQHDQ